MVKGSKSNSVTRPNLLRGMFALLGLLIVSLLLYFIVIKENFQNNPTTIIFYYMDGCGWCEKMKPEWKKCEEKASSKGLNTKKINANDADPSELKKLNITGFPSFVIDKNNNKTLYPSDEPRTAEGLINYATKL